jgi:uncharacterized protein YndB with AHSA1/START domain
MLVPILGVAAAAVAGVLGFAATRANQFRVQRMRHINASPDRVFAMINDFRNWTQWSPWEHIDPAMKKTYTGSPSGAGAVYAWEGNSKVGKGTMEITSAEPSRNIGIKLDFLKPFEAHNTAQFVLEPRDGGTDVSWIMSGNHNLITKVMGVFMSMDKMVGKDFEKGLNKLGESCEAR